MSGLGTQGQPANGSGCPESSLAEDLLRGADKIAEFIFGETSSALRQRVYRLRDEAPLFPLGRELCARKSTLLKWIAEREGK